MDDFFRQVWDLDEPVVVRFRHELHPANERLLAALGAGYIVDENAPPCPPGPGGPPRCGRKECTVSAQVNQCVRAELGRDGELIVVAADCWKCRREVMPVHGGECPWCGSQIVDEASLSAKQMLADLRERTNGLQHGDVDGRDLLDRMDAGEPLVEDDAEPEPDDEAEHGLGEAAAGSIGAGRPAASSSPNGRAGRGQAQLAVLKSLIEGNSTAALIGKALERAPNFVSATLINLQKKGLVEKVAYGRYTATDAGRKAAAAGVALDAKSSGREPKAKEAERTVPAAIVSPPAPPEAQTASRPDEPQPDDPAAVYIAEVKLLLDLIDLLDVDPAENDALLAVVQNPGGGGWIHDDARRLFRRLVREELDRCSADDIADAVIATIDGRAA